MFVHVVGVLIAALTQQADSGEAWQTSDGAIAITIPKGFRLTNTKGLNDSKSGVVGSRWVDGEAYVQAYKRPINPKRINQPINLKQLLKSRTDEWTVESRCRLLESSIDSSQDFPVLSLTLSTGTSIVKERIVVTASAVYIVGASGATKSFETDPRFQQFLQSMRIQPSAVPPPLGERDSDSDTLNEVSGKIGAMGFILLIFCGAWIYEKRRKAKTPKTAD